MRRLPNGGKTPSQLTICSAVRVISLLDRICVRYRRSGPDAQVEGSGINSDQHTAVWHWSVEMVPLARCSENKPARSFDVPGADLSLLSGKKHVYERIEEADILSR